MIVEKIIHAAAVLPPSSCTLLARCRGRGEIVEARKLTVATRAI
ncbi:hypothetical protein [Paenibacillus silvisoli]|nr:hypothetical protein [Paenibacillus silvisoli]